MSSTRNKKKEQQKRSVAVRYRTASSHTKSRKVAIVRQTTHSDYDLSEIGLGLAMLEGKTSEDLQKKYTG